MRLLLAFILLPLLGAPLAAASYAPAVYYLKDDGLGAAVPGLLNSSMPRAAQPSQRVVPLAAPNVPAAAFQTEAGLVHLPKIYGPVYVGLYLGPAAVVDGNLTITLLAKNGTKTIPIANATMSLDANLSKAPDPTGMVPPDPTDPEGAAAYELGKLLPMLTPPPRLLYLGSVEAVLNASDPILVSFVITPKAGADVAQGAAATIQYNATLAPSFLYVPWYKPDPPRSVPVRVIEPTREYQTLDPTDGAGDETGQAKSRRHGLPGPDAALLLLSMALTLAFVARRRRA